MHRGCLRCAWGCGWQVVCLCAGRECPLLRPASPSPFRGRADAVNYVHWMCQNIRSLLFISAQKPAFLPAQLHHDHAVGGSDEVMDLTLGLRVPSVHRQTSPRHSSQTPHCLHTGGCGCPASCSSAGAIFPTAFAPFASESHLDSSHDIFSFFVVFISVWGSVTSDQDCLDAQAAFASSEVFSMRVGHCPSDPVLLWHRSIDCSLAETETAFMHTGEWNT